jgi:hypothetical protein
MLSILLFPVDVVGYDIAVDFDGDSGDVKKKRHGRDDGD